MNRLKKNAFRLLESALGKQGTVLAIRVWEPATFFEIDIHCPHINMHKWTQVQHMKVKVADGIYRDYTPAGWDAVTNTCTLYINASQDGPGSRWVKSLQPGDLFTHVGVAPTPHKPEQQGAMICVGDMSSIGHYLALQQLTHQRALRGVVLIKEAQHRSLFKDYFRWPLQAISPTENQGIPALEKWLEQQSLKNSTLYLAGNTGTCVQLRKRVRHFSEPPSQVKAIGFWS